MTKTHKIYGFTLAEMLIVIVILGILTGLSTFGYRGWQQGLAQRQVRSELVTALSAMESTKNFGSGYPLTLPTSYKPGNDVTVTIAWVDSTRFCAQAVSTKYSSVRYFLDTTQGKDPRSGNCPASPIVPTVPPAAPSPGSTPTSSSTISVSWSAVTNATSYTVRYSMYDPTTGTIACTSSSTTCIISGLTANTVYNVSVVATNAYGSSSPGTSSATTFAAPVPPPPAPTGTPAIATSGPTAYSTPYPYNRFIFTASGVSCASGTLQWKFVVQTGPSAPSSATWADATDWQTSNTEQLDITRNRLENVRYIFAKPRCQGSTGLTTDHPGYANTQVTSNG